MKLLSWNVNGIRAVHRKGFLEWLREESPDILGTQELKAQAGQLPKELLEPEGYHASWNWGERKGYSGVGILSREPPLRVQSGIGIERFDTEGRVILAEFPQFTLLNIYFPNGQSSQERLDYKMAFYDAFLGVRRGPPRPGPKPRSLWRLQHRSPRHRPGPAQGEREHLRLPAHRAGVDGPV